MPPYFFINIVNPGDFFLHYSHKKIENAIYRNILLLNYWNDFEEKFNLKICLN